MGGNGTILRTTNGGASWIAQASGTNIRLYGVFFTDANTGTAVGWLGTILRTTTGGVVSVKDVRQSEIPREVALHQNYPNPFNPSTNIGFTIQTSGSTLLKVFDVLGREVATLVNEEIQPGTYEVTWDAKDLPSGVYFYNLQTGTFVQTRKMILLK